MSDKIVEDFDVTIKRTVEIYLQKWHKHFRFADIFENSAQNHTQDGQIVQFRNHVNVIVYMV